MKHSIGSMLLITVIALASSCKKKNDTSGSVNFQLRTQNQNTQLGGRMQSGALSWTSGSAFVEKIDFEAEKNDDTELEVESRVRRRVDLFGSVSQLGSIQLEPGRYDEIEIELNLGSAAGDTSLILRGTYVNNSGATIPVLFFINQRLEVSAEAENVVLTGVDDYRFLTTFDLSRLTWGITQSQLSSASLTNGVLVISANSNSNIYSKIISNIHDMDDVSIDD